MFVAWIIILFYEHKWWELLEFTALFCSFWNWDEYCKMEKYFLRTSFSSNSIIVIKFIIYWISFDFFVNPDINPAFFTSFSGPAYDISGVFPFFYGSFINCWVEEFFLDYFFACLDGSLPIANKFLSSYCNTKLLFIFSIILRF